MAEEGCQKGTMPFKVMTEKDLEKAKSKRSERIRFYTLKFQDVYGSIDRYAKIKNARLNDPGLKLDENQELLVPENEVQKYMKLYNILSATYAGTFIEN